IDSNQIIIEQINYYVYITTINVNNSYVYDYNIHKADKFNLLIGYDIENKPIRFNISKPSNSHIGIFASTRGGKSNLMYLLLCQLIQFGRMDIELDIINPKIVDFYEFEHVKNVKNYTEDTDQALEILLENIELMNHRYNTFKRNNVKSLEQYRKINKMPYKMIVIDEVATFQGDKEFHNALTILANKSAGAGIILILSSQLLNKDIMTNQVRQNLNTTFGGKCKDKVKSDMIYENSNLHLDIKRVGQFKIYDNFNNGALTQVLEVKNNTISELCNRNKKVARATNSNNLDKNIH
ncbi:MAG: FtsK/SpoIIIE domain-containing protein, partial [Peptostreptococcaceae bacterium]